MPSLGVMLEGSKVSLHFRASSADLDVRYTKFDPSSLTSKLASPLGSRPSVSLLCTQTRLIDRAPPVIIRPGDSERALMLGSDSEFSSDEAVTLEAPLDGSDTGHVRARGSRVLLISYGRRALLSRSLGHGIGMQVSSKYL